MFDGILNREKKETQKTSGAERRFQFETMTNDEGREVLFFHRVSQSDIHWGTKHSRAKRLYEFLHDTQTRERHLVGDIYDGERLRLKQAWNMGPYHRQGQAAILRDADKGTRTIAYKGNHEEDICETITDKNGEKHPYRNLAGKTILGVEYRLDSERMDARGRRIFTVHGDAFDNCLFGERGPFKKFIYGLGGNAMDLAFEIDTLLHKIPGLEHTSVASWGKKRVKWIINEGLGVRKQVENFLDSSAHDCLIYGHTHMPGFEWTKGGKLRINDGCCTEHVNALVEDKNGNLAIMTWHKHGAEVIEEPLAPGKEPLKYYMTREELGLAPYSPVPLMPENEYTARADRLNRLVCRQWAALDRSSITAEISLQAKLVRAAHALSEAGRMDLFPGGLRAAMQVAAKLEESQQRLEELPVPIQRPSREQMGLSPAKILGLEPVA